MLHRFISEPKTATSEAATLRASRRQFLKGSAAAGAGLVIGLHLASGRLTSAQAADAATSPFVGYIRIAPDNTVTVTSAHFEMGQGAYSGCATLAAEELDADWSQVRADGGAGNPKLYGNLAWGGAIQGTGGSTAMASSFERYRKAGAMARVMLVAAAAKAWNVPAAEVAVAKGVVSHASGKSATFGELAEAAAAETPPAEVTLKDPSTWTLIGKADLHRLDHVDKTTGQQQYTLDVRLPGMLTAVIARPPQFGSTVKSFDATAAKAVKDVVDVVQIPRGVAVVATNMFAARKGRDALTVQWDDTNAEKRGSADLMAEYKKLAAGTEAAVARNDGDVAAAFAGAAKVVEGDFEFPYLAHAAMEPLDAVAWRQGDQLEVWGGHQMPDLYQAVAAQIAELKPEQVKLHVMMSGGSFGRRAVADADVIDEAVSTAKAIGWKAPVRVVWTREDDMTGGRYRPMYFHRLKAGLDADGKIVAWQQRIVGQSILTGTPFEGFMVKDGVDGTSVEGGSNLPYAIPNIHVDLITPKVGVPVLWWRSVGSTHNAYSTEALLDEVAEAAGKDPIEFRLAMLGDKPRHKAVLEKAREVSGWGTAMVKGKGRGVAVAESFGSFVAQVAEVSVTDGAIKVERIVCVVDCGVAVNPDVIKAQMEGGIGYGLGAILKGEITLDAGKVQQTNFDGYDVLHLDEMPVVEVHILPSAETPTGVGEPGVPPVGPAVANAIYQATGKRIRILPMSKSDLKSA
jgi:isoquinoline 1-oxidoreductase beta subunit